jgi:hypothetical protein
MIREATIPDCIGFRCPCYGNCEGLFEGEPECLEHKGARTEWGFIDSGYVYAPYIPLEIDREIMAAKNWVRDEIIKSFMVPGYVFGIDTGEK